MAVLEHGVELGYARTELARGGHRWAPGVVEVVVAQVGLQVDIRAVETIRIALIVALAQVTRLRGSMAAHAVLVQDGLHQQRVRYWIAAGSLGLQRGGRSPKGGGHVRARLGGPVPPFMASLAGNPG